VRDNEDDREEDEDEDVFEGEAVPEFPGIVAAAAVIWLGVGILAFLNVCANFVLAGMRGGQQPGGDNACGGYCCMGGLAIAFLAVGNHTFKGKAADTLGNGIGSLVLGLLSLGLGIPAIILGLRGVAPANQQFKTEFFVIMGTILGAFGLLLILAGVFALVGRSDYREWKQFKREQARNRQRGRRWDDDFDDD
jgi:hypothetical protein